MDKWIVAGLKLVYCEDETPICEIALASGTNTSTARYLVAQLNLHKAKPEKLP